ncbi:sugar ABC transporter substrate-binding protein [Carnobacterium gallinarum]|uniref:sugar ABC transporter substrate-binding protein n=1 Tax=Carnobacterium gallinarum TaxID=2749 RepID=UPI00054E6D94|nr:sugar ABC transporter substrate-binding protein [Carnobacterium gallinarum]
MNMKKKIALISSIALVSVGLLAGCSSGKDDSKKATDSDKVTFWYMGDGSKEIQPILNDFEKESGVKVDIQSIPWSASHDKLLTAVASGEGPDVVQMGTTWMAEFVDAGALKDISSYIDSEKNLKSENFFDGSVTTTKFDDKYYAVPWYTETRALYYRTDLLKEVGYDKAPATWEELSDAATKLADRGKDMYGFGADLAEPTSAFMFARQNGSELFDKNGTPLFDKKPFVEAVSYLDKFIQNGSAPKADLGLDISQTFGGTGIVPMFISGPWMINAITENAPDIEGKWATAVLPKKENNMSSTGGANLAVFESSKNEKNAMKLIEFLARPENQLTFFKNSNSLPTSHKSWEDPILADDKMISIFGEQLQNSEPMPMMKEWEEISQNYLKSWEQIYGNGADVQKQMNELNDQTKTLLGK